MTQARQGDDPQQGAAHLPRLAVRPRLAVAAVVVVVDAEGDVDAASGDRIRDQAAGVHIGVREGRGTGEAPARTHHLTMPLRLQYSVMVSA